jgi:hypothetical protein
MGASSLHRVRPITRGKAAPVSPRGKKKTTFAKLNREARQRDRRAEKQAKKEARREAAASPVPDVPSAEHLDDDSGAEDET